MTVQITDDDRAKADRLLFAEPRHPIADSERLAFAIAEARAAGYAAGLEEAADEAHESGYREGYNAGALAGLELARSERSTADAVRRYPFAGPHR